MNLQRRLKYFSRKEYIAQLQENRIEPCIRLLCSFSLWLHHQLSSWRFLFHLSGPFLFFLPRADSRQRVCLFPGLGDRPNL